VRAEVLSRTPSEDEINPVDYDYGFRLSQEYDGFLEKVGDRRLGSCASFVIATSIAISLYTGIGHKQ